MLPNRLITYKHVTALNYSTYIKKIQTVVIPNFYPMVSKDISRKPKKSQQCMTP